MPSAAVGRLALNLLPEISGAITQAGALTGGGGPVLVAIARIMGLEGVATRAVAGQLFALVRRAMLAGQALELGTIGPADIRTLAPINPALFGGARIEGGLEYRVVVEWTDRLTRQRMTALIPIEVLEPLSNQQIADMAAFELAQEYEIAAEEIMPGSVNVIAVHSVQGRS